jgi:lipoprotein-releasing system permease protein
MSGLNDLLDVLILNRTAHIRLYNEVQPSKIQPIDRFKEFNQSHNFVNSVKPKTSKIEIYNYGAIYQALKKDSRVLGISPKISCQVFYNVGATDLSGNINGIDVEAENKLFSFSEYVVAGNIFDLKNNSNISVVLVDLVITKDLMN